MISTGPQRSSLSGLRWSLQSLSVSVVSTGLYVSISLRGLYGSLLSLPVSTAPYSLYQSQVVSTGPSVVSTGSYSVYQLQVVSTGLYSLCQTAGTSGDW